MPVIRTFAIKSVQTVYAEGYPQPKETTIASFLDANRAASFMVNLRRIFMQQNAALRELDRQSRTLRDIDPDCRELWSESVLFDADSKEAVGTAIQWDSYGYIDKISEPKPDKRHFFIEEGRLIG